MALVGNIQDFGLSDFLYLVDRGYKTGCLHLERGNDAAVLFFEKGKLIYAARGDGNEENNVLVMLGKITPQQLEQAMQARSNGSNGQTLSQAIVSENILSQEELQQTLQTHIEESVVYQLFGWPDGEFRFEHGQKPAPEAPVMPIPVAVEHLIMEGVRRIDEWGRIKDRIPNTDMIVRFVDQPDKAKGVKLAPEEWRVFARINGKDTLATIAQKTNLSDFDVCRVVYGFATAGLVEVVKKPTAAPRGSGDAPRVKRSLVSRIISRIEKM